MSSSEISHRAAETETSGLMFKPQHTHMTHRLVEMLRRGLDSLPSANNRAVEEEEEETKRGWAVEMEETCIKMKTGWWGGERCGGLRDRLVLTLRFNIWYWSFTSGGMSFFCSFLTVQRNDQCLLREKMSDRSRTQQNGRIFCIMISSYEQTLTQNFITTNCCPMTPLLTPLNKFRMKYNSNNSIGPTYAFVKTWPFNNYH